MRSLRRRTSFTPARTRSEGLACGWSAGAELWCEGDDTYLRCPPESLVGVVPMNRDTWSALTSIDSGARSTGDVARRALASGWLVPARYSMT